MAHSCPQCDQVCYCGGDIDDAILEEGAEDCSHCDGREDLRGGDYDEED